MTHLLVRYICIVPPDTTRPQCWSSSQRFILAFLLSDFTLYRNIFWDLYILDLLIQIVMYVVSPFLNFLPCNSRHIWVPHFTSLTPTFVAIPSFAAVRRDLVYAHEHICKVQPQQGGLHLTNISMYKQKSLFTTFSASFYCFICVLSSSSESSLQKLFMQKQ